MSINNKIEISRNADQIHELCSSVQIGRDSFSKAINLKACDGGLVEVLRNAKCDLDW
jgi:hypothetical protein